MQDRDINAQTSALNAVHVRRPALSILKSATSLKKLQKRCFEVGVRSEEVGGKKAPHFLYIMKRSELIKILKKYGCYIIREGANHEVWHS